MSVEPGRIGARLGRALAAGAAVVGIVAASIIGLNDVADDLALTPHVSSAHGSGQSATES